MSRSGVSARFRHNPYSLTEVSIRIRPRKIGSQQEISLFGLQLEQASQPASVPNTPATSTKSNSELQLPAGGMGAKTSVTSTKPNSKRQLPVGGRRISDKELLDAVENAKCRVATIDYMGGIYTGPVQTLRNKKTAPEWYSNGLRKFNSDSDFWSIQTENGKSTGRVKIGTQVYNGPLRYNERQGCWEPE